MRTSHVEAVIVAVVVAGVGDKVAPAATELQVLEPRPATGAGTHVTVEIFLGKDEERALPGIARAVAHERAVHWSQWIKDLTRVTESVEALPVPGAGAELEPLGSGEVLDPLTGPNPQRDGREVIAMEAEVEP